MGSENGGCEAKTGICIIAFIIFNFLVYKCPKTGLNCLGDCAKIMHVLWY